jgi:hypothetical protein
LPILDWSRIDSWKVNKSPVDKGNSDNSGRPVLSVCNQQCCVLVSCEMGPALGAEELETRKVGDASGVTVTEGRKNHIEESSPQARVTEIPEPERTARMNAFRFAAEFLERGSVHLQRHRGAFNDGKSRSPILPYVTHWCISACVIHVNTFCTSFVWYTHNPLNF